MGTGTKSIQKKWLVFARIGGYMMVYSKVVNQDNVDEECLEQRRYQTPSMILLSAKNKDALQMQIKKLLEVLKNKDWKENSIEDIAYTLQVGRTSMTERLGILASSIEDLIGKLEKIIIGEETFSSSVRLGRKPDTITLEQKQEQEKAVRNCIQTRDFNTLLQLWTDGAVVEWEDIYAGNINKPCKIALPTYPFHHRQQAKKKESLLLYTPVWRKKQDEKIDKSVLMKRFVVLVEPPNDMESQVNSSLHSTEYIIIKSKTNEVNLCYEEIVTRLAGKFRGVFGEDLQEKLLFQVVLFRDEYDIMQGIRGFLKTIEVENPQVFCQMIQLEREIEIHEMIHRLNENIVFTNRRDIRYYQGIRYVRGLKRLYIEDGKNNIKKGLPWRKDGVYLITGGAGAIGFLFAQEIVKQEKNATIILIGRSELNKQKIERIEEWNHDRQRVVYWKADITEKEQVQQLIQRIINRYGHLNGIIHSAGMIKDHLLVNKTEEEFVQVLKPKTSGLVYLDSCTSFIDIDFFALFSSGTVAMGNAGQTDYTAANGFMDAFAEFRNRLVKRGERRGKTISINWPFWKNGGMSLSKKLIQIMFQENGLWPMETDLGIKVFYYALTSEVSQVLVMSGDIDRISKSLGKQFELVGSHEKTDYTEKNAEVVEETEDEAVAIIGLSGRFPMAENIQEFWENVKVSRNCITELPKKRWPMETYFEANKEKAFQSGKSYCKWGGFLEGFDEFDPTFFHISPVEAQRMDPQERLFLQECWKAVEDAGYVPSKMNAELKKKTGVYGAITKTGFMLWNRGGNNYYNTSFASFVNRVSYFMDFSGPSIAIDTMCSSSLVAVYEACKNLLKGDINMAVVGGCNLYLHPFNFQYLSQLRMLGDKPRSSVFEKDGIGFTPSEGVGAMVLKRLSDAKRDKDAIWAIIRGGAVRHSGKTNGYSVPDPGKIADVIKEALDNSKLKPETIRHIEVGANGSELADAMEMEAITRVYQRTNQKAGMGQDYYTLGSIKSILGHGEAVSGFAQLLKAILQLKYKELCALPMPNNVTEQIDFDRLPYKILKKCKYFTESSYQSKRIPRRIGVNSLGAGGVYAHLILEEYMEKREYSNFQRDDKPKLFLFSAKSETSLCKYMEKWRDYLVYNANLDMRALSYVLQVKREAMEKRVAIVAVTRDELLRCITDWEKGVDNPNNFVEEQLSCGSTRMKTVSHQEIADCLRNQNFSELAKLWIQRNRIPWECLYENCPVPEHIAMLPVYPFKKKAFWVDTGLDLDSEQFISLEEMYKEKEQEENINNKKHMNIAEIIHIIKELLCEILYLDDTDEFDEYTNFMDLGIDSVYTKVFIKSFNEKTGLNLRETEMFNHSNTIEFAKFAVSKSEIGG